MENLTGWFLGNVKPARSGVYERSTPEPAVVPPTRIFSYYSVLYDCWGVLAPSVEEAYNFRHTSSAFQTRTWRGLEKP